MASTSKLVLPPLLACAFAASALAQSTLTVGPTGQHATIQAAIVAATSGDTIEVAAGTYLEAIDYLGKDLAIVATGTVAQGSHVIDAQGTDTVVRLVNGEGPTTRLQGFTITGGQGAPGQPGGIRILGAEPVIRDCWIVGNAGGSPSSSPVSGGGDGGPGGIDIELAGGQQVTLEGCAFVNNVGGTGTAYYGSGGQQLIPALGGAGGISIASTGQYSAVGLSIRACHFDGNVGGTGEGGWSNNPWGPATFIPARDGAGAVSLTSDNLSALVATSSFRDNVGAGDAAGAIDLLPTLGSSYTYGNAVEIEDCFLTGNQNGAVRVATDVPTTLRRCLLHANLGTTIGFTWSSLPFGTPQITVTDCDLIGNSGGPAFLGLSGNVIERSVVFGHDATGYPYFPVPTLIDGASVKNSVLWNNNGAAISTGVQYSCIEGGQYGTGNIASNPQFVRDPSPGPDTVWGTADDDLGDLRLQPTSPCIDAGNPSAMANGLDLGGHPRLLDGDLDGSQRLDMGAHEFGHVRLELSTPAPQQLTLALTGTPNLPTVLAMGLPAVQTTMLAPFGELFLDLGAPIIVAPVGSLPTTLSYALPAGALDLMFQAAVLDSAGGNVSNPQALRIL